MELSRAYEPILRATVKGLKKDKLPPTTSYSHEEIHELIAANGVKQNSAFPEFKMLVYEDGIKFEKASDGTKFPEIPFGSIHQLIVLPNFPDVCFLSFRRRSGEVYVILRMKKVEHLNKLAKIITVWNETALSDTERTSPSPPPPPTPPQQQQQQAKNPPRTKDSKKAASSVPSQNPLIPVRTHSRKAPEFQRNRSHKHHDYPCDDQCEYICVKHQVPTEKVIINRPRTVSQPPRYVPDYPRRRFGSSTGSWDVENEVVTGPIQPYRPPYEGYRVIVPKHRYNRHHRRSRPVREIRSHRVIAQESDSYSSSTITTSSDLTILDARGRPIKTIYPSFMVGGRMSPRSLYNENLLQTLHRPLNAC